MHIEKLVWLFMALALVNIVSCGPSAKKSSAARTAQEEVTENEQGIYRAELESLSGQARGTIIFKALGDDFQLKEIVEGVAPGTRHFQFVLDGETCPTEDFNGDGHIDLSETLAQSGKILLPLDGNLESQFEGLNFGPISNESGAFIYRKTASLSRLLSDLRADDPDTADEFVKLDDKQLVFNRKVVIVLGTNAELPLSVSQYGENSRADSLPVACGQLIRSADEDLPTTTIAE